MDRGLKAFLIIGGLVFFAMWVPYLICKIEYHCKYGWEGWWKEW
jgi:hypothetical protein